MRHLPTPGSSFGFRLGFGDFKGKVLPRHESKSYYVNNYYCRSCKEEVEVDWIVHFACGVVLNHESIVGSLGGQIND